ncbi:hypothetical protein CJU89_3255 [Yarrowia sp. B02]|nr:hypothetical protein CJU89_3255 [Yarrowia sp. B02]
MDNYPEDYVAHLTPLVGLLGLTPFSDDVADKFSALKLDSADSGAPNAATTHGEVLNRFLPPVCDNPKAQALCENLLGGFESKSQGYPLIWNGNNAVRASRKMIPHFLHLQSIANDFILPKSKANKADLSSASNTPSIGSEGFEINIQQHGHSPLSPMNSDSDLFPDGIISPEWLKKYTQHLPSTVVSFYTLSPETVKTMALEALSQDILALKSQLSVRDLRPIVVMVVDDYSPAAQTAVNEAINQLRKQTGLNKTTLTAISIGATQKELDTLCESVCQTAWANANEFYTNVAKRIRRKLTRNSSSIPALKSQQAGGQSLDDQLLQLTDTLPLTHMGWVVRYSYKLACLTEFRQDVETATKAYETAYEALVECFDNIWPRPEAVQNGSTSSMAATVSVAPSGDPLQRTLRWEQARALLDTIAFKIAKLYLYYGNPSTATRKFRLHLETVKEMAAEKLGYKSAIEYSQTPAYLGWMALQTAGMAEIVSKSAFFKTDSPFAATSGPGLTPTAASTLPRAGFLYLEAIDYIERRQQLDDEAFDDPSRDPYPREATEAEGGLLTRRTEPSILADLYQRVIADFSRKTGGGGTRNLAVAHLRLGQLLSSVEELQTAGAILAKASWPSLLKQCILALCEQYREAKDVKAALACAVYLTSDKFGSSDQSERVPFDCHITTLCKGLSGVSTTDFTAANMGIGAVSYIPFKANFCFEQPEFHLKVPGRCQLTLTSQLHRVVSQVTLSTLWLQLSGTLHPVCIEHDETSLADGAIANLATPSVETRNGSKVIVYKANLTFTGPVKRFQMTISPETLGEAYCTGCIVSFAGFRIEVPLQIERSARAVEWFFKKDGVMRSKALVSTESHHMVRTLPRPAQLKTELQLPAALLFGETVSGSLVVTNNEPGPISMSLACKVAWNVRDGTDKNLPEEAPVLTWDEEGDKDIESMESATFKFTLKVPNSKIAGLTGSVPAAVVNLQFSSIYNLGDPDSPIRFNKGYTRQLHRPLVVGFSVSPAVHPDDWPSFFVPAEGDEKSPSPIIKKRWRVDARITHYAQGHAEADENPLELVSAKLIFVSKSDHSVCEVVQEPCSETGEPLAGALVSRSDSGHGSFLSTCQFDTYREDQEVRSVTVEAVLQITWKRHGAELQESFEYDANPLRLTLPILEPRCIAHLPNGAVSRGYAFQMDYYIENATAHVLTFLVTLGDATAPVAATGMIPPKDTPADFLYDGPRKFSLRLLPFSRRLISAQLVHQENPNAGLGLTWFKLPNIKVYDPVYRKTLSVLSGDRQIRADARTYETYLRM